MSCELFLPSDSTLIASYSALPFVLDLHLYQSSLRLMRYSNANDTYDSFPTVYHYRRAQLAMTP